MVPQLKLLSAVINETLRLYPSASDIPRFTTADPELNRFSIPPRPLLHAPTTLARRRG